MLTRHKVEPPLHMKKLPPNIDRKALFVDAVNLINKYKGASLAATLSTATFDKHFGILFKERKVMGVYGMCFMLGVVMSSKFAEEAKYQGDIPLVMDTGNVYRRHIVDAHRSAVASNDRYHLGRLSFATDNLNALQAADMISWSARRDLTKGLTNEFAPLLGLFDNRHWSQPVADSVMAELARKLDGKIT